MLRGIVPESVEVGGGALIVAGGLFRIATA
jgi:hypothetical protein